MTKKINPRNHLSNLIMASSKEKARERTRRQLQPRGRKEQIHLAHIARRKAMMMNIVGSFIWS